MRRLAFVALSCVALLGPATAYGQRGAPRPAPTANGTTVEVNLVVGEQKTIPSADIASYSPGTPGIVEVKMPTPDLMVFQAVHPGTTTVLVIKENGQQITYRITVSAKALGPLEGELEQLISGYSGIRIRRVGARFFIEGGVATEADARRMALIASLYPGQVESLVVVGSVGAEHSINVRVDLYFVQYDKSSNYGIGISYPGSIGPGDVTASLAFAQGVQPVPQATFSIDQALPSLDIAQTRGWAKVLKHSAVITTSGTEATFENGGEQNFAVAAGLTGTIQAIKFGTNVTVLPRYDSSTHDLEVKVKADISDLTPAASTSTLPGRQTATMNTFVHLKLGQSIVLSGIRTWSVQHSVTGLPVLSMIPILNFIFGSHSNSESDTEGAIYIIPSIIESVPRKAHDITDTAMREYEDYDGDIRHVSSFPEPPPSYQ
jgi:pilus assembly protein CpaC